MRKKNSEEAVPKILTAQETALAEAHLAAVDPVLARLIALHGPCTLGEHVACDPFGDLAASIISQQLSAKAADTILARAMTHFGSLSPEAVLAVSAEDLRAAGISRPKIRYLKALAGAVQSGELDFASLANQSSEDVIATLTLVPGIGRWTAEMFLIFVLGHSDVLSLGDAGLKRAARKLYGEKKELGSIGRKWRPYSSVACWYLWRHLDANTLV